MTDLSANFSIKRWPEEERPREKLIHYGAELLTDAHNKANLRLEQLRHTLKSIKDKHGIPLELIDMEIQEGGTFPIHNKMYEAIAGSEIIICDLTGHRCYNRWR